MRHVVSDDEGVHVLGAADVLNGLGGEGRVGAYLTGFPHGEMGKLGDVPLWLDEEVAKVVGCLAGHELRVGDVDELILKDCAARDDFEASVFAADEASRGKRVLHGASSENTSPGCLTASRFAEHPVGEPPGQPKLVSRQSQTPGWPGSVEDPRPSGCFAKRSGGGSSELLGAEWPLEVDREYQRVAKLVSKAKAR